MDHLKKRIGFVFTILLLSFLLVPGCNVKARSKMRFTAKTVGKISKKNTIRLSWKKCSGATSYRIYRSKAFKKQPDIWSIDLKFKRIKKLGKKARRFTDKKRAYGRWYVYEVRAYKKNRCIDTDMMYVCTKPDPVFFHSDYENTSFSWIDIIVDVEHVGYAPDGVVVYRKNATGRSSWKKIAVRKRKKGKWQIPYKDANVSSGKFYKYRVRSYKTVKGKRKYGDYTYAQKIGAVKPMGVYAVEYTNPEFGSSTEEIILKVTSRQYNNVLSMYDNMIGTDAGGREFYFDLYYSLPGFTGWSKVTDNNVLLNPGQSMYLKLTDPRPYKKGMTWDDYEDRQPFEMPENGCKFYTDLSLKYGDYYCDFYIDLRQRKGNKGIAVVPKSNIEYFIPLINRPD